ncbi:MAG: (5-formylfuran-3-yl)methyl phosphate synthase [Geminicoccaceae bacterium]
MTNATDNRPGLLASVADLAEVTLALPMADLIDLKDPAQGALGAWPLGRIGEAVRLIAGRKPVSATVGDLPPQADLLAEAALATAAEGVDLVKLGFFPGGDHARLARDLTPVASRGVALVAVLMADRAPDLDIVTHLAAAGFRGAMLDTADKMAGGLLQHQTVAALTSFVKEARGHGLLVGLAGSLQLADVATLRPIAPDFLGFRGAFCERDRTTGLVPARLAAVRAAIDQTMAAAESVEPPYRF